MKFSNLHTHTLFSDGKNSVRENIEAAKALGMASLGISDHSMTPFDLRYCMRPETHYEKYEDTVREEIARAAGEGFPVFLGIEFDAGSEVDREKYDYCIGSVHYILTEDRMYPVDSGINYQLDCVEKEFHGNRLDYAKYYFEEVVRHAERNRPDIIGHFDLLTKHGLIDENDETYRKLLLDAMAETLKYVKLFEINAGAMARGLKKEPYPNPVFLADLHAMGGRVILSSDAHYSANLLFGFEQMRQEAKNAGFTSLSYFDGKKFKEAPIDGFIL